MLFLQKLVYHIQREKTNLFWATTLLHYPRGLKPNAKALRFLSKSLHSLDTRCESLLPER